MRTPPNESVSSAIAETKGTRASASERRCVLSGDTLLRDQLVRLAISPDGLVLPDPAAKAPGRGAWITPDRSALEQAMSDGQLKRALMRAFKGGPADAKLTVPDDLPDLIEAALRRSLTERLGLEWRAGTLVLGSARIEEHARTGRVALLCHANDAREDGRKRLDQAWRVGCDAEGSGLRGTTLPLDRASLSVALGRENTVHMGVAGHAGDRRAAIRVSQAIDRLARYTGGECAAFEGSNIDAVSAAHAE
ncbi:MAG: DUF448 domain-containing protein [Pseudomonadota bacterium]